MFRIKGSTIHCSRGDECIITLSIPITDINNYIKYTDELNNVFWYDSNNKVIYDVNYNESEVTVDTLNIVLYEFQIGDKLTFNIYNKKGYDEKTLMTKEVSVEQKGNSIDIPLTAKNTTFSNPINKATTFWYDITLNDSMTVIGFDENEAKEFIMYPAKGDGE